MFARTVPPAKNQSASRETEQGMWRSGYRVCLRSRRSRVRISASSFFLFFCLRDVADDVLFRTSHFARRTAKCGGGGGRRRARGCAGVLKLGKVSPIREIFINRDEKCRDREETTTKTDVRSTETRTTPATFSRRSETTRRRWDEREAKGSLSGTLDRARMFARVRYARRSTRSSSLVALASGPFPSPFRSAAAARRRF